MATRTTNTGEVTQAVLNVVISSALSKDKIDEIAAQCAPQVAEMFKARIIEGVETYFDDYLDVAEIIQDDNEIQDRIALAVRSVFGIAPR